MTPQLDELLSQYRLQYRTTWRDKSESYWLSRLVEEVGELSSALNNRHEHTPDLELMQIAGICTNWLEMRSERRDFGGEGMNDIDVSKWQETKASIEKEIELCKEALDFYRSEYKVSLFYAETMNYRLEKLEEKLKEYQE